MYNYPIVPFGAGQGQASTVKQSCKVVLSSLGVELAHINEAMAYSRFEKNVPGFSTVVCLNMYRHFGDKVHSAYQSKRQGFPNSAFEINVN